MRTTLRTLLVTLLVLFAGCCRAHFHPTYSDPLTTQWFKSCAPTPRGVAVVIHGLNQDPRSLDALILELQRVGFHAYRPILAGHLEKTSEPFPSEVWVNETTAAIVAARKRYPNLPILLVGYSLGGALATLSASEPGEPPTPTAMVLIAPALSLRWPLDVAEYLDVTPRSVLEFPSLAPDGYRRFPDTPLFWYANTLDLYARADQLSDATKLHQIPTLVLLNPNDELVSDTGMITWISSRGLANSWTTKEITPKPTLRGLPAHLFIDEFTNGSASWSVMIGAIKNFLDAQYGTSRADCATLS